MKKFFDGIEINLQNVLTVIDHINSLHRDQNTYHSFAETRDGEIVFIHGDSSVLQMSTFDFTDDEFDNGDIVFCKPLGQANLMQFGEMIYLDNLYISDEYRGNGLSKIFMAFIENLTIAKDKHYVRLDRLERLVSDKEVFEYRGKPGEIDKFEIIKQDPSFVNLTKALYESIGFFEISQEHLINRQTNYLVPMVKTDLKHTPLKCANIFDKIDDFAFDEMDYIGTTNLDKIYEKHFVDHEIKKKFEDKDFSIRGRDI